MKDSKFYKKFNNCCFELSAEDIFDLNKNDNGPVNNVIARIDRHCYGVKLYDDEYGLTAEMFYVNNDNTLKGDIIKIEITDPDYFELLLRFCVLLSNDYIGVDAVDTFNTFQIKLRGFLEKLGFFTTTNLELNQFEGESSFMMAKSSRGILKLELIEKVKFYRKIFSNIHNSGFIENNDYVYLMLNGDTSLIKIGTSRNPKYREGTLQSKEPNIHLIAKWCCSKGFEKVLHDKFKDRRIRGEWFRLNINELYDVKKFMDSQSQM